MKSARLLYALALFIGTMLATTAQNKTETLFTFFDGETEYQLIRHQIEIAPGDMGTSTDVEPDFKFKKWVLEKPIVDTIRDPDDPSIILVLDTMVSMQIHFAKAFPINYTVLNEQIRLIKDNASDQGLEIGNVQYSIFLHDGSLIVLWDLPAEDQMSEARLVFVTFELWKNDNRMKYSLLFEN